jgi:hypothetical protein
VQALVPGQGLPALGGVMKDLSEQTLLEMRVGRERVRMHQALDRFEADMEHRFGAAGGKLRANFVGERGNWRVQVSMGDTVIGVDPLDEFPSEHLMTKIALVLG